jgi:hypothetical protein
VEQRRIIRADRRLHVGVLPRLDLLASTGLVDRGRLGLQAGLPIRDDAPHAREN